MNCRIHSLRRVVFLVIAILLLNLGVNVPALAESFDSDEREYVRNEISQFPTISAGSVRLAPTLAVAPTPGTRITVTYDNNKSYNPYGYFYAKSRTATIEIKHKNFSPNDFNIGVEYSPYYFGEFGPIEKKNIAFKPVSGKEDTYSGQLAFTEDGHYGLHIEGTDYLNKKPVIFSDYFLIDTVAPVIEFTFDKEKEKGGFFPDVLTGTLLVKEAHFDQRFIKISIKHKLPGQPKFTDIPVSDSFDKGTAITYSKTIPLTVEGLYTIDISYTDQSGHAAAPVHEEFMIDRAAPVLDVQFDDDEVVTSNYYNKFRTASITVEESNFDPGLVKIEQYANRDGKDVKPPVVSSWRSEGNKHTAVILYDTDGEYSLAASCSDLAGRQSEAYEGEKFVIDTSPPLLTVTGIPTGATDQAIIAPVIEYSDPNLAPESVDIQLKGLRRGAIHDFKELKAEVTGGRIEYKPLPRAKEMDDLYTITANMADKANNKISETIRFSVNRFGSIYVFSDETKALAGTYVKTAPDVSVTETNVNKLTTNRVTLFKDNLSITLKEGADYSIEKSGDDDSFYQYVYLVHGSNFSDDGMYRLSFSSKDSAGNVSESTSTPEGSNISFVVDNTAPIVSFLNLEEGKAYDARELDVVFSADDNVKLSGVILYLDGEIVREWSASEIEELISEKEDFHYTVMGGSNKARHLRVICADAAGNQTEMEVSNFYVSTNRWVHIMNNDQLMLLIYVGAALAFLLSAVTVFLILSRRAKKRRKLSQKVEPSYPGAPNFSVPDYNRTAAGYGQSPASPPYPAAPMSAAGYAPDPARPAYPTAPTPAAGYGQDPARPAYPTAPTPVAGSTVENPYIYRGIDKGFSPDIWEDTIRSDQPITNQLYPQSYEQPYPAGDVVQPDQNGRHADARDPSKLNFGETTVLSNQRDNETTVLDDHRG